MGEGEVGQNKMQGAHGEEEGGGVEEGTEA